MALTAVAVFCDDIRQEVGNKVSIIGVYGGDIKFKAKPPIVYPKLCVAVWLDGDLADIPESITVHVLAQPGRASVFSAELKRPESKADPTTHRARMQTLVEISPVMLKAPGRLEVEVEAGRETLKAGHLDVRFEAPDEPVTSASEQQQPS